MPWAKEPMGCSAEKWGTVALSHPGQTSDPVVDVLAHLEQQPLVGSKVWHRPAWNARQAEWWQTRLDHA